VFLHGVSGPYDVASLMKLNCNSLHAAYGSHAGVGISKSSKPLPCSRLASRPIGRPRAAAPQPRSPLGRFDGLVRRVAEASPPAEAADVQIDLKNDEDKEYTVSGAHLELRRWRCLGLDVKQRE